MGLERGEIKEVRNGQCGSWCCRVGGRGWNKEALGRDREREEMGALL